MSFVEDVFKGGNIVTGLAIGIGGLILAPIVVPVVVAIVKPLAKVAVRGGVALYKMGREVTTTLPPFPAGKQGGMRLPLRLARRRVAPSRKGTGRLGGVPRRAGRLTP